LIIAAIMLVANTIRLSAFNRRRERDQRLVGASNCVSFRSIEGVIAGLFGWLVAVGLLTVAKAGLTACRTTSRSMSSCPRSTSPRS
jgi:cell division transport system permease protein